MAKQTWRHSPSPYVDIQAHQKKITSNIEKLRVEIAREQVKLLPGGLLDKKLKGR